VILHACNLTALERQKQEDREFEDSLGYTTKLYLKRQKKKKKKQE
jgi:hypothetical protein